MSGKNPSFTDSALSPISSLSGKRNVSSTVSEKVSFQVTSPINKRSTLAEILIDCEDIDDYDI